MATDPNLSDSNLPNSSANLGWEDWTGSKGAIDKDITWFRDAFIKHLGQDYWNSRNEYPHPNQSISTLLFYEGNGRLDNDGLQVLFSSSARGLYWLAEYSQDGTIPARNAYTRGTGIAGQTDWEAGTWSGAGSEGAQISTQNIDGAQSRVRLSVFGTAGDFAYATLDMDPASGLGYFALTNAPLYLSSYTSDPTVSDGSMWYRSDTDNFRVRANGVTYDLLHSGSIIVLSNLGLPYTSVAVNTLVTSTNCFIDVDASGANRTITLPSAATLTSGFTYIIRKLDSSNNTVIVDPNSTQTIDGVTTYTLTKQYETLTIVSNGTNWDIWSAYNNQLYVAQTATFTVGPRDTVISVSTAAGAVTANLPTAVGIAGREITIKKTTNDANFLTLDGSGSETIEGVSTYIITSIGEVTIYSNGANWLVKSESFGGYITRTTTYTTTITDRKVTANASGGAFTITLIAASSVAGERVMFRKIGTDTNLVTLDANSSETIDGAATLGLMTPGEWAELLSDGTNWLIVGYGS